ncbi:hypothetical protein ZHAS_00015888 [Anopheles sinensis]|uniref:Glyco_hydro_18 domain-containing protein n=1 Tax=Anopheles sinensis TaxID=74873 RepID=A0A084WC97_ANOSI|nr:hypothetical protein ZHAS_00015888 [Anopheles sinensis]
MKDRYVRLLKDLRQACDRYGLLLTVTVPSRPSVIEVNYPVEKLEKYADFVILSTTEFRKLRKTSFIAPLYSSSPGSSNSIDYHVDRWKLAGLSCGKIVIVIQTMTLTYKLYIQNEYRVGTPALQLKIRPYYKICRKLYSGSLEIWDSSAKSPYAFRDLSWYSYENEKSIKEKVGFVVQQNLAGLAVFYYDEDDPINICGDGQYPLTTIVMAAMQSDYLPPSVITDSQIYHFDSPLKSSAFSQMGQDIYNSAANNKQAYDVFVEESSDAIEQLGKAIDIYQRSQVPSDCTGKLSGGQELIEQPPLQSVGSMEIVFDDLLLSAEQSAECFEGDEMFSSNIGTIVNLGDSVDMRMLSSGSVDQATIAESNRSPGSATVNGVQLFSENVQLSGTNKNPLFSEQSNSQRVVYTEPSCSQHRPIRPCSHCGSIAPPPPHPPKPCLHKLPSLRIFATAHGPTTTTTTTTTTPKPMEFLTMAPATYRPPTFCQACNPCVKLVATSGSHEPKAPTTPPVPLHTPSSCLSAQLYSEMNGGQLSPSSLQLQANVDRVSAPVSVKFQANSVGAQLIPSFGPFETKVCPCDGILQDPHDKRSYYLCKRGLPMCEENKFTCAHGYVFDERCKKCVVEGS